MINDIKNSIKARLYDFTYTPFLSSTVISWFVINHKYVLIYMADYTLDKKLILLDNYDFSFQTSWFEIPLAMNVWFPILFGLFYTFVYPLASKKFYEYTLQKNKELKEIKKDIEDTTPITQEEARILRESITQLTENKYELEKKLIEVENRYKKRLEESNSRSLPLPTAKVPQINDEKTDVTKNIKSAEDDKTKILRFFYESNYTYAELDELLDDIFNRLNIARPKAQLLVKQLVEEKILGYDEYRQIIITDYGNNTLLDMFDK